MKTLFEKLSKENREKVINNPLFDNMKELLNENFHEIELMLKDAAYFWWTIYPNKPFDLAEYYKLFED